jgi:hypothetical protein
MPSIALTNCRVGNNFSHLHAHSAGSWVISAPIVDARLKKELRGRNASATGMDIGGYSSYYRSYSRARETGEICDHCRPETCSHMQRMPQTTAGTTHPTHSYELVSWFALARCLLVALRCCSLAVCTAETAVKACEGRVHRYVHMHVGAPF